MIQSVKIEIFNFSLSGTLECGQCFRFRKDPDGIYSGVAVGHSIRLRQTDSILEVFGIDAGLFENTYSGYLGLNIDYPAIMTSLGEDKTMRKVLERVPGIRVLRQPLFETLISFIISQNNNIPRISGIIERLCRSFGDELIGGEYDFPHPGTLASLTPESLADIRCGFRDKYIIDAAQRWVSGEIREDILEHAPLNAARSELMKIYGVGPKVADCVLLFGAGRFDAFPEDVWIKRAMKELFPEGLPKSAAPYAGIAQQYIYHYARNHLFKQLR